MGGHFVSPASIMVLSILWLLHKYTLSQLYHPESLEKPTKRHAWKARWLASLAGTRRLSPIHRGLAACLCLPFLVSINAIHVLLRGVAELGVIRIALFLSDIHKSSYFLSKDQTRSFPVKLAVSPHVLNSLPAVETIATYPACLVALLAHLDMVHRYIIWNESGPETDLC